MAGKQEWDRLTPTRWLVQLLVRRFSGLRGIRRNSSVMSAPRAATAGNGPVPRGWPRSTWGYGDWGGLDVGADGRAAGWPDQRRRCRYLRRAHLRAQPPPVRGLRRCARGVAVTADPYATAADLVARSAATYAASVPDDPADDGFFGPGSVTWRVSADLAVPVAGLRSLLMQALHPLAMARVDQHSGWGQDPG